VVKKMRQELFAGLAGQNGRSSVTFTERKDEGSVLRNRHGAGPGDFPERWMRDGTAKNSGEGAGAGTQPGVENPY
jgi:hypothetical protein